MDVLCVGGLYRSYGAMWRGGVCAIKMSPRWGYDRVSVALIYCFNLY